MMRALLGADIFFLFSILIRLRPGISRRNLEESELDTHRRRELLIDGFDCSEVCRVMYILLYRVVKQGFAFTSSSLTTYLEDLI
jgi:hypothetical protein